MLKLSALSLLLLFSPYAFANKQAPEHQEETKSVGSHAITPEISLADLKKGIDAKTIFVVDANKPETFESGHIPTAINFAKNEKNFADVLPKDKNKLIVAYCGGPMCTAWQAPAKQALALGYTNVKHYKGGIKGWKKASYPVEN